MPRSREPWIRTTTGSPARRSGGMRSSTTRPLGCSMIRPACQLRLGDAKTCRRLQQRAGLATYARSWPLPRSTGNTSTSRTMGATDLRWCSATASSWTTRCSLLRSMPWPAACGSSRWMPGATARRPAGGPFDYWDLANDVLALMDHLDMAAATLAGMSQGGFVGLRAALLAPDG